MRIIKPLIALMLALVLVFSLFGCSPKPEQPPVPETPTTPETPAVPVEPVKIQLNEVTHSVFYAPQYAAIELGYFADEGIELELINGAGADKVMTAVLTGASQIGLAGPEASIYVYLEGRSDYCQVFAQLTKRDGSFLVGREPDPDFTWEKLRGSFTLGGRKGGMPLMNLEYLLKSKGLVPGTDLTVDTSVQFAAMAGAFVGGTGDYTTLFEPTASMLEREGKGYVLASIGEDVGEVPYTAYFTSKSFIAENPELIAAFTRAIYRGQQWVKDNDAAEIARVIAPQFPDTDLELLTTVTQRHKDIDAWYTTPVMPEEAFDRLQDIMETAGELSERVPYGDLVNNTFAEEVLK
ncbi:MAG TPA: ABC transporter substrate-binding protein [Terriglobales bacterium]|nr:ABC transporter substrate-binding protein [Terriglobales bacterium]